MRRRIGTVAATVAVGAMGTVVALSGLVAGCGGDDTTNAAPDGSGAEGQDGTIADGANVEEQAAADSPSTSSDAGSPESGDVGTIPEGGGVDAAVETGTTVPLTGFPHAVDEAFCQRLQQCCLVSPSAWQQEGPNGCVTALDESGGALGIANFNSALDSGSVAYNESAAASCLNTLSTINCGVIQSPAYNSLVSLCFSAMQGTLGIDTSGCVSSLQCKTGEVCALASDGGAGVCVLLSGQGQPCKDTTNSTDCTYLGNGTPALYCTKVDGGSTECQPSKPTNSTCNFNPECQSGLCNAPACVTSIVFSDPGTPNGICSSFIVVDAGDGG